MQKRIHKFILACALLAAGGLLPSVRLEVLAAEAGPADSSVEPKPTEIPGSPAAAAPAAEAGNSWIDRVSEQEEADSRQSLTREQNARYDRLDAFFTTAVKYDDDRHRWSWGEKRAPYTIDEDRRNVERTVARLNGLQMGVNDEIYMILEFYSPAQMRELDRRLKDNKAPRLKEMIDEYLAAVESILTSGIQSEVDYYLVHELGVAASAGPVSERDRGNVRNAYGNFAFQRSGEEGRDFVLKNYLGPQAAKEIVSAKGHPDGGSLQPRRTNRGQVTFTEVALMGMLASVFVFLLFLGVFILAQEIKAARWVRQGQGEYGKGQWDPAIAAFTRALELNPNDLRACLERGRACHAARRFPEAVEDFTRAIALNPFMAYAYHSRGLACEQLGDLTASIKDQTKAIELDPCFSAAFEGRARAYGGLRQYDRAREDVRRLKELGIFVDEEWVKALGQERGSA